MRVFLPKILASPCRHEVDMIDKQIYLSKMIPGKTYKVVIEDCCITGEVTGVFLGLDRDEESDREFRLKFNFGYIDAYAHAIRIYESKTVFPEYEVGKRMLELISHL